MIDGAAEQPLGAAGPESLRVFRSCPLIAAKDAQSSLQMLAIARYGCALRQGREALAFARHKQSSGLFMSGLSLDRTPFECAARSRPKNSQALRPLVDGGPALAPLVRGYLPRYGQAGLVHTPYSDSA